MATTTNNLSRVSPGVYRNNTGRLVRPVGGLPKTTSPTPTQPTQTNTDTTNNAVTATTYKDPNRVKGRIDFLTKNRPNDPEIARLNSWLTQFGTAPTPAPAPAPAPAQEAAPTTPAPTESAPPTPTDAAGSSYDFSTYRSPMTQALLNALNTGMSTMQAYEPQSFEGSPMYQFQKQKGMADIEKLMAARGLTGSGAEIQGNKDFLVELNATEAEKQRQYAESNRDRQQRAMEFVANFDKSERDALRDQWNKDLDLKTNIQQFEANRGDARQALAVNFLTNLLGLQSQNDIAKLAQGGLNSQTEMSKALMQMIGNSIMSQVPRVSGGGGGGAPPPPPSNNSGLLDILLRYGNNAGNNDMFDGILRMIGGK